MKKALSIILALALVFSMLPATFATEGEVAETLEYVISYQAEGLERRGGFTGTSYEVTKNAGVSPNYWYYSGQYRMQGASLENESFYFATQVTRATTAGNGMTFRIDVPEGGLYKAYVPYFGISTGGKMSVYLVSKTDADNKNWNMTIKNNTAAGNGTYLAMKDYVDNGDNSVVKRIVGDVDTYNDGRSATDVYNAETADEIDGITVELNKDEYYLIYSISGVGELANSAGTTPCYYITPRGLRLERLPTVTATCGDAEIEIGETTTVIASALDRTDVATTAEYTYSSSSDAIATVDENGVVTGVSGGTATITATATIDGYEVSGSVDVVVLPEDQGNDGVTLEYIFKTSVLTDETIALAQEKGVWDSRGFPTDLSIVEDYSALNQTTAPWAFGGFKGYGYQMQNNVLMSMDKGNYGHATLSPFFALKLKVSNKGWYKLAVDVNQANFGTAANVYILPVGDIEKIDRTHIANEKAIGTFDVRLGSSDVGNVYIPKRGNYYIFMDFNSKNPTTQGTSTRHYLYLNKIILSATDAPTPDTVDSEISFAATANIDADITVEGFDYNGTVDSVEAGTTVKVTAPKQVGDYEFKYWKTGYDNSKNCVSASNAYEFTALTNIFLTAVYDKADVTSDNEVKVEFYNGNKQFISETTIAKDAAFSTIKPANPSMAGLTFKGWATDEGLLTDASTFDEDTRVVAQYEEAGNAISGTIYADYAERAENTYGAEITLENANAKYWMRDGKIVGYGTKYTHFAWAGTKITSSIANIEKKPIVVLETAPVDGAYMIEYDSADKNILEVGILFGNSTNIKVNSCYAKATSQEKAAHGQFAAKAASGESVSAGMQGYARGYLIYGSAGNYNVIYTDAVAVQ